MRSVLPICAGLVVISGIISANMWFELRSERQTNAGLQIKLTDANSRIQSLTLAAQHNNVQPAPATAPAAVADTKAAAPAPPVVPQPVFVSSQQDYQAREKEMMADPEYRKARLAQQRMSTERNFPGLVEELGLSEKEADRLFDMLTESQMNMSAELSALFGNGGQLSKEARAEIESKQLAMQRKQDEDVAAQLGPARYAQWQDYKPTQGGRVQAVQYGTQLAQAGQPLSDVQQRGLTSVVIAEQKRMLQQMEPLYRNVNQADPQTRMQLQEQAMKMEEEFNRRILDSAAAHLTARQIASLKQQFETQAVLSAAQTRASRRRMEVQGQ